MDYKEEIIKGEELREKLKSGVNKLADTVCLTLGPNGSTIIIPDEYGEPYITKDGVSVANRIVLKDTIENTAATLLKQVAEVTVDEAGDGTTTSLCLAQAFINTGFDLLNEGISYNNIKKELEILEEEVVKGLKDSSIKLKYNKIVDVATISANNDKKIGELIQKAYNHSKIVKVEEGGKFEDELITISGIELDTGYFNSAFINNGNKQAIEYNEPLVMLINGKLNSLDNIGRILQLIQDKPIVIIADHFSENVVNILKKNYNTGALKIALVKSPGFASFRKDLMADISIYTGAELLKSHVKYTELNKLGTLDSIFITKEKCILTNTKNTTETDERLLELTTFIKDNSKEDSTLIEQRIENLTGKVAIIKVGGKSEVEMKERMDRIDDAVLSVQCALEEGIVEGASVSLYKIMAFNLKNSMTDTTIRLFQCISAPYNKISTSTNKLYLNRNLIKEGIIDPLKVTRCALQNAISVAKTILGTDAIVLN